MTNQDTDKESGEHGGRALHLGLRYCDLDGLRMVACAAVVVNHMDKRWLPGGFTGVDVFFVISGFVVALSARNRYGILEFYARRIRRLMPLSVVVVATTATAMLFIIPTVLGQADRLDIDTDAPRRVADAGLCSLVGWTNIWLAVRAIHTNDNYWGEGRASSAFNPFTHFWSLGVEEQFYLLFPLVLATWRRWRRIGTAAVVCTFMASLVLCGVHQSAAHPLQDATFYLSYTRAWELLVGVALAWLATSTTFRPATTRVGRLLPHLLSLVGVLLLGCSFAFANAEDAINRTLFPLPMALGAVGGVACFILSSIVARSTTTATPNDGGAVLPMANRLLATPPCVYGGNISYALYLWHWPCFVVLKWTTGFHCLESKVVGLGATLTLAIASHHVIERPVQQWAKAFPNVLTAIPLVAACAAVAPLLILRSTVAVPASHPTTPPNNPFAFIPHCNALQKTNATTWKVDERCFSHNAFTSYLEACVSLHQRTSVASTWDGPQYQCEPQLQRTLHLAGDSHAVHLGHGLQAALLGQYKLLRHPMPYMMTDAAWGDGPNEFMPYAIEEMRGCAVPALVQETRGVVIPNRSRDREVAASWARHVAHRVRPGDVVLHAAYLLRASYVDRDHPQRLQELVSRLTMELHELHDALAPKGVPLILTSGTPVLKYNGRECFSEVDTTHTWQICGPQCASTIVASRTLLQPWIIALRQFSSSRHNVHFFDVHDEVCNEQTGYCGPVLPVWHGPTHVDDNHLSHEGSFSLWPRLRKLFQDAGLLVSPPSTR